MILDFSDALIAEHNTSAIFGAPIIQYEKGMTIPETCIIAGVPNEVYHAQPHLSNSQLALFMRSPAHLECAKPKERTRFMEIGTALHTAVLEPERFDKEYVLLPDVKDRRSSVYKEAVKIHTSERVLVSTEIENVVGLQQTALANPMYRDEYQSKPHHVELSFFGICSRTGVPIRCRFDLLTDDGMALDLKKTQDIRHDNISRSLLNYNYHIQHEFYKHVYECVTKKPLHSFRFFFIEELAPHANVIANLCHETIQIAQQELTEALDLYAQKPDPTTGIWNDETVVSLPIWKLNQLAGEIH